MTCAMTKLGLGLLSPDFHVKDLRFYICLFGGQLDLAYLF